VRSESVWGLPSLRVAQLTPSYLPMVGGTEVYVDSLSSYLGKQGVSNEIIALCVTRKWERSKQLTKNVIDARRVLVWPSYGIGPLRSPMTRILRAHYLPAHRSLLREHLEAFDLLHFHDEVDLSFPTILLGVNKPRLFTLHSFENTFRYYQTNRMARGMLSKSADLFHVFSHGQKTKLQSLGVKNEEIRVVPNGVDVREFKPATRRVSREAIRIVSLGRIERGKGLINLLESIRLLKTTRAARNGIEVQIAGSVWDSQYYDELLAYKRKMELDEVSFTGPVDRATSKVLLRQADIFVLPSLRETFSIVNLEAMASGLPVVASAVGAMPEVVVDGETGFLVPPNDSETIAERVSLLVNDDKLRRRMGRKARKRAEDYYSMDAVAKKILGLYGELA
jgi:glycosyltransferase involved in cell wall biosynthesis